MYMPIKPLAIDNGIAMTQPSPSFSIFHCAIWHSATLRSWECRGLGDIIPIARLSLNFHVHMGLMCQYSTIQVCTLISYVCMCAWGGEYIKWNLFITDKLVHEVLLFRGILY